MCRYDETLNECVYLFDKVSVEDNSIRVTGEYLATFDWEQGRFQNIFDISNSIDNGVRAYAVSFEEDIVVIAWATRVSAYHMKSGELIYEFLAEEDKFCEIKDVCLVDGTFMIACNDGLWEISL